MTYNLRDEIAKGISDTYILKCKDCTPDCLTCQYETNTIADAVLDVLRSKGFREWAEDQSDYGRRNHEEWLDALFGEVG